MPEIMREQRGTWQPRGLSRRAVIKGAAWSVPVIAVATAVPMASASGGTGGATPNGALALPSWEPHWYRDTTPQRNAYLQVFAQVYAPYVSANGADQTHITSATATFRVKSEAVANPIEAVVLDDTAGGPAVGWVYGGAATDPADAAYTIFTFTWTGDLNPAGNDNTTQMRFTTRAGAPVVDGSGYTADVTATVTSPQVPGALTETKNTGSV